MFVRPIDFQKLFLYAVIRVLWIWCNSYCVIRLGLDATIFYSPAWFCPGWYNRKLKFVWYQPLCVSAVSRILRSAASSQGKAFRKSFLECFRPMRCSFWDGRNLFSQIITKTYFNRSVVLAFEMCFFFLDSVNRS